ncbi:MULTISPECIES: ABC transporter permease subunit [unclassified Devosia]|uniref:ABC transporter permease n=1 Tax=unclassified Devosia TaxID=196773 RepID=UPI00145D254B|nr:MULTISPECIES: ABC transporter permease subunit [unclassified Devosia]MBJ6988077.1 ABC transporter permease subunit [Devosia sp. MC521]MBK1794423.1 ABC transporter permease subunit [Devosia sp. WQ 349K1]QMW63366.1 ABC transporter permease subunit [Devosia sp. MC521]
MNFQLIWDNLGFFAQGAQLTIFLTIASLALAFVASVPLALARNSANRYVSGAVAGYTLLFRGTPLLVQLFLIYYGLAQFDLVRESVLWPWLSSPLICVILAFVLNTTAYTTEIFAGSLRHIPVGEIEAAKSFGMRPLAMTRHILLPAMLTRSLQLYGNETILMMHATSLASTVTLLELTGVARNISLNRYVMLEPYVAIGVIYLVLSLVLVGIFRFAERRWASYLRRDQQSAR